MILFCFGEMKLGYLDSNQECLIGNRNYQLCYTPSIYVSDRRRSYVGNHSETRNLSPGVACSSRLIPRGATQA